MKRCWPFWSRFFATRRASIAPFIESEKKPMIYRGKHNTLLRAELESYPIRAPSRFSLLATIFTIILLLGTIFTFTVASPRAAASTTSQQAQRTSSAATAPSAAASPTWYFAEGSVGGSFQEYLTLFNPGASTATVTVTYLFTSQSPKTFTHTVSPASRATINVNTELGIPPTAKQQSISVMLSSTVPIVAERPLYFTYNGIASGTDVIGATNANSTIYYFAEGSSSTGYWTFVSILNPSKTNTAHVRIRYYGNGGLLGFQDLSIGAMKRGTGSPASVGIHQQVAIMLTSDIGIVAERPLYFSANIPAAGGATTGAASVVGTTGPGSDWLFAEGYTGTNFQEYLTLANFTYASASAKVKLLYTNGTSQTVSVTIPSLSFLNFDVNYASAHPLPGSKPTTSVAAEVTASTPSIVAERVMYFHYGAQNISGGTDVIGEAGPSSHSLYNFAEGYVSSTFSEFLTLLNPNSAAETVTVNIYSSGLLKTITQQVAAQSRATVNINSYVPSGRGASLSVQAQSGTIIAERPMYFIMGSSQGGTDVIGFTGDPSAGKPPCSTGVPPVSATPIYIGNTTQPWVALTFDAGGDVAPASTILSILNNRGIHATWFFTGQWAQQNPQTLTGVAQAGYLIGNHTMTHADLPTIPADDVCRQLNQADQTISGISGRSTTRPYARPPDGATSSDSLQTTAKLGYRTVMWTIDTLDWQQDSTPERIISIIQSKITNGAIILMHAGSSSEAQALDRVITMLQNDGYSFKTVNEIIQGT
jgi:peptidoglycan/xylan/chitin deacetylase (PgdA/CDA1 family)